MATSSFISTALDTLPARREKLQKAYSELDSHRSLLSKSVTEWKELEDYFAELEKTLRQKFEELAEKEKELETRINESKESLDKREESISAREDASLARIQEQKDAAIAAILEEKRKLTEEREAKGDNVSLASSDVQVQKTEDAPKPDFVEVNGKIEQKKENAAVQGTNKESEVRVRPALKSLCENMDGEGLRKYIIEHRKDISALRKEVPSALQSVIDPSRLVLKALEGYDIPTLKATDNKDSGASADCRASILLLESLSGVLTDPLLGNDHPVVSPNIKESAKEVARRWRSKMDIQGNDPHVNPFDAQAFLQLLATFGIASEFNDDELCKLVFLISHRKDAPDLFRSLGLSSKIPDLVDTLAKGGKQIQALSFAHAFGIMDTLEPVSMLKTFLKDARKAAEESAKNVPNKGSGQSEAKELSALRAVLKAVKEYNLEAKYPTDNLQERVTQLEKARAEKKRTAGGDRDQSKRYRSGGAAGMGPGRTPFPPGGPDNKTLYRSDRGQYGVAGVPSYGVAAGAAGTHDRRMQGGYGSMYGASSRSPLSLSSSLQYPGDGLGSNLYGANSAFTNPPGSYGGYQFGSSLSQSAYQPFIR